jgi:hypothetical protein
MSAGVVPMTRVSPRRNGAVKHRQKTVTFTSTFTNRKCGEGRHLGHMSEPVEVGAFSGMGRVGLEPTTIGLKVPPDFRVHTSILAKNMGIDHGITSVFVNQISTNKHQSLHQHLHHATGSAGRSESAPRPLRTRGAR